MKTLVGLVFIPGAMLCGAIAAAVSQRIRDLLFLGILLFSPLTELYDINFVSRDWYRGTTRGFEVSLVDIFTVSVLVAMWVAPRPGEKRAYWPPSLGLMLLVLLYSAFNVGIADPKLFGLFELSKMTRALVTFLAVALYVRGDRELKLFLFGLGMAVCYQGYLALTQRYLYGVHRVYGTIADANSLSFFLCGTVPVLIGAVNARLPLWLRGLCAAGIALGLVGVILTISRAGIAVLALVSLGVTLATMSWRITGRKLAIALVVLMGISAVAAKSFRTIQARYQESNLAQEYKNKRNLGRGYYIRIATAIALDRPFGVGLNNWSYWVSQQYGPRLGYRFVPYRGTDREPSTVIPPNSNVDMAQAAPAHSLGALTLGELGIPGLLLVLLLWLRWFQMGSVFLFRRIPEVWWRTGAGILFGLGGMFLQSLTEWVFRQSQINYMAHILLGVLASLYWRRRAWRREQADTAAADLPEPWNEAEPASVRTG